MVFMAKGRQMGTRKKQLVYIIYHDLCLRVNKGVVSKFTHVFRGSNTAVLSSITFDVILFPQKWSRSDRQLGSLGFLVRNLRYTAFKGIGFFLVNKEFLNFKSGSMAFVCWWDFSLMTR